MDKAVGERLTVYIKSKGHSMKSFAKENKMTYGSIINITAGTSVMGRQIIDQLKACYPELNLNWLLYGQGSMELTTNDIPTFEHALLKNLLKEQADNIETIKKILKLNPSDDQ